MDEINNSLSFLMAAAAAAAFVLAISTTFSLLRRLLENREPFGKEIPLVPYCHWFYGHARLVTQDDFKSSLKIIEESSNEFGQAALWALRSPVLSVSNWRDARTILLCASERHPHPILRRSVAKFVGSNSILFLNGQKWKYHRGIVARSFNPDFLEASRSAMQQVARTIANSLKQKALSLPEGKYLQVEIEPLMTMISMDIFGRTALSTDLGNCQSLSTTPIVKAFEFLMDDQMDRMRSPFSGLFYRTPTVQNRRRQQQHDVVRSFVADLINEKRDVIQAGDNDLLSHLVLSHIQDEDYRALKPEDVSDEAMTDLLMTLLLAGHHTTSATLSFALYLLAKHPNVQQACVEEINASPNLENMEALVYCTAVIWETLRLFPPAVRTSRYLDRPVRLSNGLVAKNTRTHIPIWSIHHDETVFPQAEAFRPDRWAMLQHREGILQWVERPETHSSPEITVPAGNRKAMLAFSAGARSCAGQKFALQETTIVLATLLKDFCFHLVPGFELKTSTRHFLQRPEGSLPLQIELRSSSQT